jgi:DNA-binding response OmpR family regulator
VESWSSIQASVLVVEDDDVVREPLREFLEVMLPDAEIVDVREDEAAAAAQSLSPDVILVDIALPKRDGVETVRKLKAAAPEAKIVALTMEEDEEYLDAVRSAGAGACICIWEVRQRLLPALRELLMPKAEGQARRTVVCVEDEVDVVDLIDYILARHDFKTVAALGGRTALDVIRRVKPDLVLLDLMMPDVTGWEVFRQLKADEETKDIPIIVVSVLGPRWSEKKGLDPTAVEGYVVKPFVPHELVQQINRTLEVVA